MISLVQFKHSDRLFGRQINLYYLGRESLKGVDRDGAGYPLFCIDTSNTKRNMHDLERPLIKHTEPSAATAFCESLFVDDGGFLGRPFILNDIDGLFDFPPESSAEYIKYRKAYDEGSLPVAVTKLEADVQTSDTSLEMNTLKRLEARVAAFKKASRQDLEDKQ
ncbi:MAG: hypothetical protein HZA63_17455 [Rhodocyclales bacterium]|nr:hypothetical protein [Rhodocyclales bacterium]